MNFRTEYMSSASPCGYIPHSSKIMLAGSCFSENIGRKLYRSGFDVFINPFGIAFNPVSVADSVKYILRGRKFRQNDFFESDGLWFNYHLHGSFAGTNKEAACSLINERIDLAQDFLLNSDVLIITFGTAWVYELAGSHKIVSNCHKVPQKNFNKRILSVSEIINAYSSLFHHLKDLNPGLRVIFTVSPVLHLKDGMIENNRSKSTLILAVHEVMKKHDFAEYFPSYEIQVDDLRDYRFYSEDMCHPNQQAIDYIWDKFKETYFDARELKEMKKVESWFMKKEHRVMKEGSKAHKLFEAQLKQETIGVFEKYPHLRTGFTDQQ